MISPWWRVHPVRSPLELPVPDLINLHAYNLVDTPEMTAPVGEQYPHVYVRGRATSQCLCLRQSYDVTIMHQNPPKRQTKHWSDLRHAQTAPHTPTDPPRLTTWWTDRRVPLTGKLIRSMPGVIGFDRWSVAGDDGRLHTTFTSRGGQLRGAWHWDGRSLWFLHPRVCVYVWVCVCVC